MEPKLRQIADMLILNGTLTDCPGIIHGKTGIAIFFFHYAQFTDKELFTDYALDLIGEIQNQIHNNSPADYETGLAGIGVGMDYLMNKGFLSADEDFFDDFDIRMYRAVMYDPWQNFSLYEGLSGYGRYWMKRLLQLKLPSTQAKECLKCIAGLIEENIQCIPEYEKSDVYCFLHDLSLIQGLEIYKGLLEQCFEWNIPSLDINQSFSRLGYSTVGNIVRKYLFNQYFNQTHPKVIGIEIPDVDFEKSTSGMGLLTGYAGEGLLRLTAIIPSNILWMNLL